MRPSSLSQLLLLALPAAVRAVFQDEVGHLDYHYELLGIPQPETTLFHRPRREEKASLIYTLSDVGVLGAVNPSNGAVVWRHLISGNITNGGGFLRASEGESWIFSALGYSVHAWDAVTGRNRFWMDFTGEVKDLEIMEMTESQRKDVLVLYDDKGTTILRRLNGNDGTMVWEFKDSTRDIPLQVSTNVERVFAVSLQGSLGSYNLRVSVLDTLTGKRVDELIIGTKGDVHDKGDVMFVGANSAAPIVGWTDESHSRLRINVLGTKNKQEFPLMADTISIEFHAPRVVQSQPHFLVHSRTKTGNRADVYHVDLKSHTITKAYDLPLLRGKGAFATNSNDATVFFTRVTENELLLTASTSPDILGRWPLQTLSSNAHAINAVSEVIKKSGQSYAVRVALVTDSDDWSLVRNGELSWTRPEGMTAAISAAFAEIPQSEELTKSLEQEAHSNPLSAYIHRVNRHINDLQYLPSYLASVLQRLIGGILGAGVPAELDKLSLDGFGFHKLIIIATRRGRLYGVDVGNSGQVRWSTKAFDISSRDQWDVKGIYVDDSKQHATVHGSQGEYVVIEMQSGETVLTMPPGTRPPVQSTAVMDSLSGPWLLSVGLNGTVSGVPIDTTPQQTVLVRGSGGELKGLTFVSKGEKSSVVTSWVFSPPNGQRIVHIASRPSHDPIASIGRALGDRRVMYKYLNPNTLVLATADDAASSLTVYLLDTISGEILSSATHEGVDIDKPVECAIAENWFLCTFFGQYTLKDNPTQSLKGYQLVISDLYESDEANDRGPLGNSANFSSLGPVELPTGGTALPSVVSQSFILAAPISALQVTQTRQGISSRQVLGYLPDSHAIIGLPRSLIEPRRPINRDPTPAEQEEGLIRYTPVIEVDPKLVITHERDVIGVHKIITSPATVESTSLVFSFGIDIFGTRVAPSFLFDILGKGFNKLTLIGTVVALGVGVMTLGPMVRKKQINTMWQV